MQPHQSPPPQAPVRPKPRRRFVRRLVLNLFWRTYILLSLMLMASTGGWLLTMRWLDLEPRAMQTAQQIASLVNLSRSALVYSDSIARIALITTLAEEEGVRVYAREPSDRVELISHDRFDARVLREVRELLGVGTLVASAVNGEGGLWIGFDIEGDAYWLRTDPSRIVPSVGGTTWLVWILMASGLSLAGAAFMAGLVNRPLKRLSLAIDKVYRGDFSASHLDETVSTREIRNVNIGFNRMAEQMARAQQERAVMLAGISHDLRTPLARLRLEVEMSVPELESQKYMAADIEQLSAIIDKFMDYARPDALQLRSVRLSDVLQVCTYPYLNASDVHIKTDVPANLLVYADEVELARIFSNLIENARRYGQSPGSPVTHMCIDAHTEGGRVRVRVYDHGSGVPEAILQRLTEPFYRADPARTCATGSGLGLSIVQKVLEHMGGSLKLSNRAEGGLQADMLLPRVKS